VVHGLWDNRVATKPAAVFPAVDEQINPLSYEDRSTKHPHIHIGSVNGGGQRSPRHKSSS